MSVVWVTSVQCKIGVQTFNFVYAALQVPMCHISMQLQGYPFKRIYGVDVIFQVNSGTVEFRKS